MTISTNLSFDLGAPRAVMAVAKKLERKALGLNSPPLSAQQLDEVIGRLDQQNWSDERQKHRDLRRLPWVLSQGDPPLYLRDSFPDLMRSLPPVVSGTKLKGLLFSCLMMVPEKNPGRLEQIAQLVNQSVLHEKQRLETANRPVTPFVQHWAKWNQVLSANGADEVAEKLLDGSLADWKERLHIPSNSPRVLSLLKAVARATCQRAGHRVAELLESVESSPSVDQKAILMNEVLLSKFAHGQLEVDQGIVGFALRHFGDPRMDSKARWGLVASRGRDLVSRWLSEEDLRLFFTYLGGDEKSERRKRYWSKFVENGRINYSRIFFSPNDWERLPKELREDPQVESRHGRFESEAATCSSAFILGIEDYFVVEFKLTGNASYLYRRQQLSLEFLSRRTFPTHDFLKRSSYLTRLLHQANNWESNFDEILSKYLSFQIPRYYDLRNLLDY